MNIGDRILIIVIAGAVLTALWYKRRQKKQGKGCCGCSGCSGCRGCSAGAAKPDRTASSDSTVPFDSTACSDRKDSSCRPS